MSIRSKSIGFLLRTAAVMLLTLLACSCQLIMGDDDCEADIIDTANQYINVTISVSASDSPVTRAMPNGGEYGDGTLKGSDRENEVKNVTLIFYKDNAGINTTSDETVVASVLSYIVRPMTANDWDENKNHVHKNTEPTTNNNEYYGQEVLYTTGNQKLEGTLLEKGETYKMLVVANAVVDVQPGDLIKNVREKIARDVFTGTGKGTDATYFVMASETDAAVTLSNPVEETSTDKTEYIYYFDCVHIERLAARIDFSTDGGTYYDNESATDPVSGYKYILTGNRAFVLTKVTPFNLYNENEYLFKRVCTGYTSSEGSYTANSISYLGDETTVAHATLTKKANNYVVDPHTTGKDNTNTFTYLSPIAADMNNAYSYSTATEQSDVAFTVCYAKENTLMPTSYLKNYATGIAFTGEYYPNGIDGTHETRTYYHYIRHQGEKTGVNDDIYNAKQWSDLAVDEASTANTPMNIGIVRNNIYRISIKGEGEGTLQVVVQETKWRHVDNPTIYL